MAEDPSAAPNAKHVPAQVLDAVYDGGCTFWDTADRYLDSEDLIGQW